MDQREAPLSPVGGRRSQALSSGVEDALQLAEVVIPDELVDEPDVLQHEGGAASQQRDVGALEGRRERGGDVSPRGDEPFPGRFAYPPRAVAEERHQKGRRGARRDR